MARTLDSIDRQIIAELTKNARVSVAELARKVCLSRNAVRQRLEHLEHDGTIRGYTIMRGQTGPSSTRAVLFVYRNDRMRGVNVLAELRRIPEVVQCDLLSGEFDLLVMVEASSADHLQQVWQQISALPDVKDIVTSIILRSVIRSDPA
ncbi:MAG: Lrp/AsnC ligand binding domain-containing protein [Bifidobacteriaceae bacterium]|jgi:DNA-binding Lrp family transcriptional regulator|nr:Lrp/AsnC ligand binding domain-containing protein [Bifidobacteriaceae bacterium]